MYDSESDYMLNMRFNHFIMWDDKVDRVWMYDGDTGIYFIELIDGKWTYYTHCLLQDNTKHWLKFIRSDDGYAKITDDEYSEEVAIPDVLIKLRPYLDD